MHEKDREREREREWSTLSPWLTDSREKPCKIRNERERERVGRGTERKRNILSLAGVVHGMYGIFSARI